MKRVYEITATATFTNTETKATANKRVTFPVIEVSAEAAIANAQTDFQIGRIIATFVPQQHQQKITATLSNIQANAK
mgnify:CR=1 FL=1|jgi:hypothetical protein|uniref:Uncharacterized protein n=1 Tax=Myoviridae sp. ctshb19 TaxID=2825194 RepID=A0A8S5UGH8_9CAUD|nr:MAG TPA: hypothetical protein [Myoviridae sp. ctshb19]